MSLRNSIHNLKICLEIGNVFAKFDQKKSNFSSHNDDAGDEELSSVLIILSLLLALSRQASAVFRNCFLTFFFDFLWISHQDIKCTMHHAPCTMELSCVFAIKETLANDL
jgi:hypothetical protein